ncbi:MAG: hypothetical protein R2844_05475 [Caldilineales bacterium]
MKQTLSRIFLIAALLAAALGVPATTAQAQPPGPRRVFLPVVKSSGSLVLLPITIVPHGSPVDSQAHFEQLRRRSIFATFYAPNTAQAMATMEGREDQVRQALLDLLGDGPVRAASDGGGSVTLPPVTASGVTYNNRGAIAQINSNGSYGMQLETDTQLANGESVSFKDAYSGSFGTCPDAGGVFEGTVSGEALLSGSRVDGNVRTDFRYRETLEATVTAHVAMNARISHYDIDGMIVVETSIQERRADNGQLITNATEVFRSRMTGSHLDPHSDNLGAAQLSWQVWGPGGGVPGGLTGGVLRAEVSEAILELSAKAVGIADAYLLEAETGWYDNGKCVKLAFDPRHLTLAPAANGQMAVTLKGKDDNNDVAANMTVTINHGAAVSPGSVTSAPGSPAQLTVTAPGTPWEPPDDPVLTVEATSRRGRAVDHSWVDMQEAIIDVNLHGGQQASYTVDENFTFIMFTDDHVRSVIVTNPYPANIATVSAFLHYEPAQGVDVYVDEDWTGRKGKPFCRDIRDERISDIDLWVQFAPGVTPDPSMRPKVYVTNIGCWRWQGTATVSSVERPYPGYDVADQTSATVTFERTRLYDINAPFQPEFYRPISGSVHWQASGSISGCTYNAGPATAPILPEDGTLAIYNYLTQGPERRTYSGSAETEIHTTEILVLSRGTTTGPADVFRPWPSLPAVDLTEVEPSGDVIYYTYEEIGGGISITYEWEFVALRQP